MYRSNVFIFVLGLFSGIYTYLLCAEMIGSTVNLMCCSKSNVVSILIKFLHEDNEKMGYTVPEIIQLFLTNSTKVSVHIKKIFEKCANAAIIISVTVVQHLDSLKKGNNGFFSN